MPAPLPEATIESAFQKLKQSVSSNDAIVFQSTTLEDVWKAAEDIERVQRQKKSLRNINRIKPLLEALDKYSKPVEILCNGTPYLPWIWAPIKLMIQLASSHIAILDKLMDAYARIAEMMPQIDRIESTFKDDTRFQMVVALVYADIIEFHRRAYKFFRMRSWHKAFDSLWKCFDSRFDTILESLARHKKLLNEEATIIDWSEARELRARVEDDLEAREKQRSKTYLHDTIAWLNVATETQDDGFDELLSKRLAGTCEWIFKNEKMKAWKDNVHGEPVLWIKGIPGAGKTILCTHLIEKIQKETQITSAYYICTSYTNGKNLTGEVMRSIALQLLRQNMNLAAFVFENFANKGFPPSVAHMRTLLKEVLSMIATTRIFIDGLDEFPSSDQRSILNELLALVKLPGDSCRVLFSSRDVDNIRKALQHKPYISFKDEKDALEKDIRAYVHDALTELRETYPFHPAVLDYVESRIIAKADGMFLWVRLVIISLKRCQNIEGLKNSVYRLPNGLKEAYGRILNQVREELSQDESEWALRILEWLACSFRPLKTYEVRDGITFHLENSILNEETKLKSTFLDLCKPLIDEGSGNTVDFVHYSAKEYILDQASGPFLNYAHAHYDIAFSCVTYLNTSSCFYDSNVSMDNLRVSVAQGFHGLYPYANEFWLHHLLKYAKRGENIDHPKYHLGKALEKLLEFWKKEPGQFASDTKLDDTTTADSIQHQVKNLADNSWLERMGIDLLTFRSYLGQEKFAHLDVNALEVKELKSDPTYFSAASNKYQSTVRFLLECTTDDLPAGLTPAMLNDFQTVYSGTAFTCRYPDCDRHSSGFGSKQKRDDHETTHAKPLRCADSSCEFFIRGFFSKSGLLKHNKRYHPAPEDIEPPKFEPWREETPPLPPPPPPPAPAPVAAPVQAPKQQPAKPAEPVVKQVAQPRPVIKRVSRARRGLLVHGCHLCTKIYRRAENLRRHELSHSKPNYFCGYQGCTHAFHRPDLLARHSKKHDLTLSAASSDLSDVATFQGKAKNDVNMEDSDDEHGDESDEDEDEDEGCSDNDDYEDNEAALENSAGVGTSKRRKTSAWGTFLTPMGQQQQRTISYQEELNTERYGGKF